MIRILRTYLISAALIMLSAVHSGAQSITLTPPSGSLQFGFSVTVLTNGNYVVVDQLFNPGGVTNAGAVHLYNGKTHALISTLTGSHTNDNIGSNGIVALPNGNFVVRTSTWDSGSSLTDVGAVTWVNGVTGLNGVVSTGNSLVGRMSNDNVGSGGVVVLQNGNYVVNSPVWDSSASITNAGAVTWANGSTGIVGVVGTGNSLVGRSANDNVGVSSSIVLLSNGHYVVRTTSWDSSASIMNAGAVTWCNGIIGTVGVVSSGNSMVGRSTGDNIGGRVNALSNGNYVISSSSWDSSASITNAGAVTWGNGVTGSRGVVSTGNSLVGRTADDLIGNVVTVLSNGNYVTCSPFWDSSASITNAGAAT